MVEAFKNQVRVETVLVRNRGVEAFRSLSILSSISLSELGTSRVIGVSLLSIPLNK